MQMGRRSFEVETVIWEPTGARARSSERFDWRCFTLERFAPFLTPVARAEFQQVWKSILHELALFGRRQLLVEFVLLSRSLRALGDAEALLETGRAIQETCRWWP
jgi:hypothetical protein